MHVAGGLRLSVPMKLMNPPITMMKIRWTATHFARLCMISENNWLPPPTTPTIVPIMLAVSAGNDVIEKTSRTETCRVRGAINASGETCRASRRADEITLYA